MSRAAGLTLHWFAGVRTHDSTNNFKLYTRSFLDADHDREPGRLRAGARVDGEGDARPAGRWPRCRPRGAIGPPGRATSSSGSGYRITCAGTGGRSSVGGGLSGGFGHALNALGWARARARAGVRSPPGSPVASGSPTRCTARSWPARPRRRAARRPARRASISGDGGAAATRLRKNTTLNASHHQRVGRCDSSSTGMISAA